MVQFVLLARAYGVPVGRRSGGRLATTVVAIKNDIIAKLSSSPVELSTALILIISTHPHPPTPTPGIVVMRHF